MHEANQSESGHLLYVAMMEITDLDSQRVRVAEPCEKATNGTVCTEPNEKKIHRHLYSQINSRTS